eukprot:CAMPEP_0181138304 /NCGR_PEP_ID=MMETSP1071-20121207/34173_1 /TAXON_ID=35127 /ORGANISM="Thalassiosira sp., Strain NH16" /LENGTH=378 /DNA_ID=CAMNT_0023225127 /DNA_START=245 /DNA_END=1381 /DNA_ORIENTATION=-
MANNNGNNAVQTHKEQATPSSASSSDRQSPFDYVPITALDDYGQSSQLRNAMESAARFGMPVLACICCHYDDDADGVVGCNDDRDQRTENAIVVCSLQRPRPGVISPAISTNGLPITIAEKGSSSSGSDIDIHTSIQGMVKLLATRDDYSPAARDSEDTMMPRHSLHTAIIATGIQSDASFLLDQLRTHIVSKYWFRYDTLPSAALEKMVRDVLLDCLGYDRSEEANSGRVSGGTGSAAPSYDEGEDDDEDGGGSSRAGRPLGVCTFLLGLDGTTMPLRRPCLTAIEANGASQQYVARAMGAGSRAANEKLSQLWRRSMSRDEAVHMMSGILKDVAQEKGWMVSEDDVDGSADGKISGLTVACETVTSKGVGIEFSIL